MNPRYYLARSYWTASGRKMTVVGASYPGGAVSETLWRVDTSHPTPERRQAIQDALDKVNSGEALFFDLGNIFLAG